MLSGIKNIQGKRHFEQPDASGYDPRGSITFDARETLIHMGKSANRSTFLHEASHLFLEHVKRNADRFGAEARQTRSVREAQRRNFIALLYAIR